MPSRTISLEQSAYERLAAAKRAGESFTDVVNRLTGAGEPSLLGLVGILPEEAAMELKETVQDLRKGNLDREQERRKRMWSET